MTIRKAGTTDLPQLSVLFDQYRVFYNQVSDTAAANTFLKERLEKEESVIFLAIEEGRVVGFTQLYPIFSSVSLKTAWLLNDLFVQDAVRGRGVAAALLKFAADFGKAAASKFLLLQTAADNFTAQSVYEKNGWKKVNDIFYERVV